MSLVDFAILVILAYAFAIYLSYLQWLSDDDNFKPGEFKDFGD